MKPITSFQNSVRPPRSGKPRVIDLFAGAGLFGYAFEKEGFDCVGAYEMDPDAAQAHGFNSRSPIHIVDLLKEKPRGRCEVLIAGPPCQGFSSIGTRKKNDPRNALCGIIPLWARAAKPKVIVIENVRGFLDSSAWRSMNDTLVGMGYDSDAIVVNARDYGVAQNRVRSLSLYSLGTIPDILSQRSSKPTRVREAFAGMSCFPNDRLHHFCRPLSQLALSRIRLVPRGGDIRDIYRSDPHLVPKSWIPVRDRIVDIWGRLKWDGISNTLRTGFMHPSRGRFLHPDQDRPLSFREAARLQAIPDEFLFFGLDGAVARQIGNAVPVNLGRAVARAVKRVL